MSTVLELRDLACVHGDRSLFDGVQTSVRSGGLLRIQGANGAGKTSLLRMICGLAMPHRGQVLWNGRPVLAEREAFVRQLVYIGHMAALKDNLSAVDNLCTSIRLAGGECSEDTAIDALAAAGLADTEWLPTRMLSQGQRRRAALARLVFAAQAGLWVLDEPFNALDAAATQWLTGLIAGHLSRGGVVVLTSHQPLAFDGAANVQVLSL